MNIPAWLEDPYVISMLVPGEVRRDEDKEPNVDAVFKRIMDQIVDGKPSASGQQLMRPMDYTVVGPDDARFVEAVDTAFMQVAKGLAVDKWTVTLRDRAKGIIDIQNIETGKTLDRHVRVAILREKGAS